MYQSKTTLVTKNYVSKRRQQELDEYLAVITNWLQKVVFGVCALLLIVVYVGNKYIQKLENEFPHYNMPERIPLREQISQDIKEMEVPEWLLYLDNSLIASNVEDIEIDLEESSLNSVELSYDAEKSYDNDTELLAQLMYAEEGVFLCEYEENPEKVERVFKLAGSVVLHRLENNFKGAETIYDVIYTKGQYAEQTLQRVSEGQEIPEIVYTWSEELLTDGAIGPKGLIYQSEFPQGEEYDQIGNQIFGVNKNYN